MGVLVRLLCWGILAVTISWANSSRADPAFERIVVLGDSLSDNGNAGRFSNGPVWVEVLAERMNLSLRPAKEGGTNFAVGGAQLDPASGPYSLRAQADLLLGRRVEQGRTLYVVWGGANDLFAAANMADPASKLRASTTSLRSVLRDVVDRGATDILMLNLPDVGMTPAVRMHGPRAAQLAGLMTERFNKEVAQLVDELRNSAPGVRLELLDVHALAGRVHAEPAAFGFVDVRTPCQGRSSCEGYLFWDDVHPTTFAHRRLAERAADLLLGSATP